VPWWAYAREHYLELAGDEAPTTTTLYYDPILDVHHRLPVVAALTTAYYAAPQFPDDARRLFDAGCAVAGIGAPRPGPIPAGRAFGSSLILAREWELTDVEDWLVDAIENSYEPTWDRHRAEFTWGMGLGEPHPRGQFNAFLAAAEAAGPGMWERLSAAPLPSCPQVVDIDFPAVALSRAEWLDGTLHLRLALLREDPGRMTSFRIVGATTTSWKVSGPDGSEIAPGPDGIVVRTPMVAGDLTITPT
jgi:hypothetical protein